MKRPLVVVAVMFISGIIVSSFFSRAVIPVVIIGLCCALFCFRRDSSFRRDCFLRVMLFVVLPCSFFTGYFRTSAAVLRYSKAQNFAEKVEDRSGILIGRVYDISESSSQLKLTLCECSLTSDNLIFDSDFDIIVFCNSSITDFESLHDLHAGNTVSLSGRTVKFEGADNPGQFDSSDYYISRGIACGFFADCLLEVQDTRYVFRDFIYNSASFLKNTILQVFDSEDASLVLAMATGERGFLSDEQEEMYRRNGLMHIMAISGLHISLIGIAIFKLVRRLGGSYSLALFAALPVSLFYSMMTGFSMSAVRALVMMGLMLVGDVFGKSYDSYSAASIAIIILLLTNPLMITDTGFLLSFGATIGIALFSGYKVKAILRPFMSGISVYLMVIPILLYSYFELPLYAQLLNVLAAPLMPILLASVFAIIITFPVFPGLSCIIAAIPHYILKIIDTLCKCAESLPYHTVLTGRPSWVVIVLYYVSFASFLLVRERNRKKTSDERGNGMWFWPAFTVAAFILISVLCSHGKSLELSFLYVGQGDGSCIEYGSSCFFVDGGSTSDKKLERRVVTPFLKHEGRAVVDGWFLSHADEDHTSALRDILEKMKSDGMSKAENELFTPADYKGAVLVNRIYLPRADAGFEDIEEMASLLGIQVIILGPGTGVRYKELELVCEGPDVPLHTESANELSMVLSLTFEEKDIALYTGDIAGEQEQSLAGRIRSEERDYAIYKVAHHGSRYSNCDEVLRAFSNMDEADHEGQDDNRRKLAVISAGRKNRYKHPHDETLDRLNSLGIEIFRTDISGAVSFLITQNGVETLG